MTLRLLNFQQPVYYAEDFCQLRKQEVSASKNMLMQPKLELTIQGLPETILTSAAQHWEITNETFKIL